MHEFLFDILSSIYYPFWYALALSFAGMYFYMFSSDATDAGKGLKVAVLRWFYLFRNSKFFRRLFFLVFYSAMIMFKTLLNRRIWLNPLSNIVGEWKLRIIDENTGCFVWNNEAIENVILFVPFVYLLLDLFCKSHSFGTIIKYGTKMVFMVSLGIEFLQLLLHLGTFQLSDIFFNSLGGALGSVIFYLGSVTFFL